MNGGMGIYAAVLGASVLGSVHCVGMCGGFVAAVSGQSKAGRRELGPLCSYQGARLLAYAGLGAVAGGLGAGLDHGAALLGLRQFAAPAMGLTLMAMATVSLLDLGQGGADESLVRLGAEARKLNALARLRVWLTRFAARRGLAAGAAAGLLSALLPCAWLWAYVAVTAGTGRASSGALVMASFWLGSVPALLGVGLLANTLRRRLAGARRGATTLLALVMFALGLFALFGKLGGAPTIESSQHEAQHEQGPLEPEQLPTTAPCH